jgi:hypothetical protein
MKTSPSKVRDGDGPMYVGLDVHRKHCYATVLGREGRAVSQEKSLNTVEELDQFLVGLDDQVQVAMEVCGVWKPLHDYIENKG